MANIIEEKVENAKKYFNEVGASSEAITRKRKIESLLYEEKDREIVGGVLKKYIKKVLEYKTNKEFGKWASEFDSMMAKANKDDEEEIASMKYDKNELFVNMYVVKYDFFYALSAAMMYLSALNEIRDKSYLKEELYVSSIGAGNLVDYWSFNYALALFQIQNPNLKLPEKIVYRAYDYKEWTDYLWELKNSANGDYKEIILSEENLFSIKTEAYLGEETGDFNKIDTSLPVDILIFPNSYNEIVGALKEERFCEIIKEIKDNNDGMVLVASEHIGGNSFADTIKKHLGQELFVNHIVDKDEKKLISEVKYASTNKVRKLLKGMELPDKPVYMDGLNKDNPNDNPWAIDGVARYNPIRHVKNNLDYSLFYLEAEEPVSFRPFTYGYLNEKDIDKKYHKASVELALLKLLEKGYFDEEKRVKEKGLESGMYSLECIGNKGEVFFKMFFFKKGQNVLVSILDDTINTAIENRMESKTKAEYYHGDGKTFKRTWGGHIFTDEEAEALVRGETIEIEYIDKSGITRTTKGRITKKKGEQGRPYYCFTPEFDEQT